ncbi:MAG: mannose/fructose/sorbose PTS transporter subunit IIA [Erysipelotrichaceae bacterium]|nr:mannose/fructose/sorbose PTS transporter subunit IIA [Erysipelotrichaceae bacterium]
MVGIILASHGGLAEGILKSATMILGEQKNVVAVSLQPNEGPETIYQKMKDATITMNEDEILFLVDLWGGTPFHQAHMLVESKKKQWVLVSGMNLPMVIEALSLKNTMNVKELANHLIENVGVRAYPEDVKDCNKKQEEQEIVTIKEGMMKYVLVRIDSRLLHGQVVTSWIPNMHPNRVLVVSDSVAHDTLRKKLIIQAAPAQVKVNVIPVSKMIQVAKDPRFGAVRALVLFETVQDVLRIIEAGVQIMEINVGSLAHKEGKVAVNKVLSLDMEDVKAFESLKEKGIHFDVRKVPNDNPENMDEMIQKAKRLLLE